ncbi:MAG: SUMF1/EgtB/PvdO family nonheme iron enzyme [Proteobacteria bacterium]|nr:SUMF1/EgtB/PvdO family nonheme iron enzyme [Pseudomonadota bacterium]
MAAVISIKGIDEAISNLNYQNPQALKSRLVHVILGFYKDESSVEALRQINAEEIIKAVWDTDSAPSIIKAKRKNLSSTKSSVNADLRRLFKEGKNPEGVIIGRDNVFVMSDEAKDKILSTVGAGAAEGEADSMRQIAESLSVIREVLSKRESLADAKSPDGLATLEDLRSTIQGLAETIGLDGKEKGLPEVAEEEESPDEIIEDDTEMTDDADIVEETLAEEEELQEAEDVEDLEDDEVEEVLEEIDEDDAPEEPDPDEDVEEGAWAGKPDVDGYGLGKGEGGTGAKSYGPGKGEGEPGGKDGIAAERTSLAEHGLEEVGVAEDLDDAEAQEEVELDEDAEEIDENEIEDILEEIDIDDSPKKVEVEEDLDNAEIEDGFEEVEVDEVPEETEEVEEVEKIGTDDNFEEIEIVEKPEEAGLPAGNLGEDDSGGGDDDETDKDKLLAEAFEGYLGAMERFYNQYILIPEGEYIIGSKEPKGDEQPEHKVQLEPFYLGKFPVTNALFEVFIEKTGYVTTAEKLGYGTVYYGRFCEEVDKRTGLARFICNATVRSESVKGAYWYQPSGLGSTLHKRRNHPVVQVSLEDAMAFAAWTGKRLPTENEWEAAARTARGHVFPWGDEWKSNACNVEENSVADATPVDQYKDLKNDLGIVDTLGNVLEWTTEAYQPAQGAGNTPIRRIVKGGSWISGNDIRLFSRFKVSPDASSNILGFRCVAY